MNLFLFLCSMQIWKQNLASLSSSVQKPHGKSIQCLQFRRRESLLPKTLHLLIILFTDSTGKYVTSSAGSPLASSKFASLWIGQERGKPNGTGPGVFLLIYNAILYWCQIAMSCSQHVRHLAREKMTKGKQFCPNWKTIGWAPISLQIPLSAMSLVQERTEKEPSYCQSIS